MQVQQAGRVRRASPKLKAYFKAYCPRIPFSGTYRFETKNGVRGSGHVRRFEAWRALPIQLEWHDENGKHYEWFRGDEFLWVQRVVTQ